MTTHRRATVAVIFVSQRTGEDDAGYQTAALAMVALAEKQQGYIGVDSARGNDGLGITVSYWADEASARAWHDHPEHAVIRDAGRGQWYTYYDLHVAEVTRSYDWIKQG
jgi:heme-degrading monooxygenase HmoA